MYRYKLSCIGIVASNAHFDFRMRGQTDLPAREAVVGGGLCRSAQGGHVDDEGLESVYKHQSRFRRRWCSMWRTPRAPTTRFRWIM